MEVQEIIEKHRKLHLPPPPITNCKIELDDEEIMNFRSRSWIRNMYNYMNQVWTGERYDSALAGAYGEGYTSCRRTDGTLRTSFQTWAWPQTTRTNYSWFRGNAGSASNGIVVGTGNSDESFDDWHLVDKDYDCVVDSFTDAGDWVNYSPTNPLVNGDIVYLSTTGTLPSSLTAYAWYYVINVGAAKFNLSSNGVDVRTFSGAGTGTATIHKRSIIGHGSSAGQLYYYGTLAPTTSTMVWDDPSRTFTQTFLRKIANYSGDIINIGEIALFGHLYYYYYSPNNAYYMMSRDKLGSIIHLANDHMITITYEMTLTYP